MKLRSGHRGSQQEGPVRRTAAESLVRPTPTTEWATTCRTRLPLLLLGVGALSNTFSLLCLSRDEIPLSSLHPAHPTGMARESFVSTDHFTMSRRMAEVRNRVAAFTTVHAECRGKALLLEILLSSPGSGGSVHLLSADLCRRLPSHDRIVDVYGEGPVVVGLDTCSEYRQIVSGVQPMPRVAGMYHSGTNLVIRTLQRHVGRVDNATSDPDGAMYEVPWGKHVHPQHRLANTIPIAEGVVKEHVLPIVVTRDPFRWMRSMCREPYDAEFYIGESEKDRSSCPTFVLNNDEGPTNRVTLFTDQMGFSKVESFNSLVEMWTSYTQAYLDASFPRLITRYEDWLLYPEQLVELISECTGAPLASMAFERVADEARPWGPRRSNEVLTEALQKLGEMDSLFETRSQDDQAYIAEHLDVKLLDMLGYERTFKRA